LKETTKNKIELVISQKQRPQVNFNMANNIIINLRAKKTKDARWLSPCPEPPKGHNCGSQHKGKSRTTIHLLRDSNTLLTYDDKLHTTQGDDYVEYFKFRESHISATM
jgi:hypothetical protein